MSDRTLKLPFYEDGPVAFTQPDFLNFDRIARDFSFDDMAFAWPNHNYPDYVRRLCLRNVLRQTDTNNCKISMYRPLNHVFGRLTYVLRDHYQLSTMLELQPKLLREFTEELLYNISHQVYQTLPHSFIQSDLDSIIEIILPLTDSTTGRRLWRAHSFSSITTKNIPQVLQLCEKTDDKLPHWLRSHIETDIQRLIKQELKQYTTYYKDSSCITTFIPNQDPGSFHSQPSFIYLVIEHIALQAKLPADSNRDFIFSNRLIHFLEKVIPQPITYLSEYNLLPTLLQIKQPDLARKVARRHLMTSLCLDQLSSNHTQTAFYYLLGITTMHKPKDHEFSQQVKSLINDTICCR